MATNAAANDEMIRRLESELEEKKNFADEILHRAHSGNRDLSDEEQNMVGEARGRMEKIKGQLTTIEDYSRSAYEARSKAADVGKAIETFRGRPQHGEVEYRSAGEYIVDHWAAATGKSREAKDRIESYERALIEQRAADHVRTSDEPGVIPTPIVGPVINFIDAARPIVNLLGARPMPSQTWWRPLVTQHTASALQGSAGGQADEKSELVSQKMTIGKVTGVANTYGGYVNVSRQTIDFSQPEAFNIIVDDLAAQYAIETEAALAAAAMTTSTTAIGYGATPTQASVAAAVWKAVAAVYTATRGKGTPYIAGSPAVLPVFGPLFAPYGQLNPAVIASQIAGQQGTGFKASNFGQGVMGEISGVPFVMSAGLTGTECFVASTASVEAYEQRVGQLQVVEPSVAGIQVAYIGYFTALKIIDAGIVPLTAT